MAKKKCIDYSKPYIIRKRPDYWVWLVITVVVACLAGNYEWNWINLPLLGIGLFFFVLSFLERNVHIIMNEEGIQIGKELLSWKEVKQGKFKKKYTRHWHVNILEITLKDDSQKEIFIDDYKYDCKKFCDIFNFHCKSKRLLVPHATPWSEFISSLIYYIIFFVIVLLIIEMYRRLILI